MAGTKERRENRERRRAGSDRRDSQHRSGGDWTTLQIPEGTSIFQPKEGTYKIDIIPYEVGEGNPYADQGTWYYERTFYVHRGIGPNNESYVCAAKTYGTRCPVCDHRGKLARDPDSDEKLITALKPKERQLWLVYDHDDTEKGVQLWEVSYHLFGKLLEKRRQGADEDEDHVRNFDDWKAGATLKVIFTEEDGGGYKFLDTTSIDFKPRPKGLDEELLEHGICLDSIIKQVDYDKLKAILLQTEEDGGDGKAEKPSKAPPPDDDDDWDDEPKKAPAKADKAPPLKTKPEPAKTDVSTAEDAGLEEGMMVKHREFGQCEIIRVSGDGTSLVLEDSGGKVHKAIGVDDVRRVEKTKPKPESKKEEKPPKPAKGKAEDDDWDADWDDESKKEEKPAKSSKAAKPAQDDDDWD